MRSAGNCRVSSESRAARASSQLSSLSPKLETTRCLRLWNRVGWSQWAGYGISFFLVVGGGGGDEWEAMIQ